MDEPNAAQIARGGKAGDIADDASSHGDENGAAVGARANEFARDILNRGEALRGFAIVEKNRSVGGRAGNFGRQSLAPRAAKREAKIE